MSDPRRSVILGKYVVPVVEAYGKQLERAMYQEQRGLVGLSEAMLPGPLEPTAKQQVAIVLARQREPLLAQEIQDKLRGNFSAELVPTLREIRTVLNQGSEFVQPERYRWQFGRRVGPWRS